MDYELPTEFDLIVVGTGVVESIVSAAASRIGKRVLHIDNNTYYGGLWASFNLDAIQHLTTNEAGQPPSIDSTKLLKENENLLGLDNNIFNLKDFEIEWHIPEKDEPQFEAPENPETINEPKRVQWSKETLLKKSRRFNIDLTPKLQFARGDFVELLISSNIARYSEYRSVSRVLTWLNGHLEVVPCSRSDVFANNKVTVIEKRMLMKLFLALDAGDQEYVGYEHKTFRNFLKDKKLTPNLIHYVLYAIAMSNDDTLCTEGVQNTKRFLNSLGRFGKTPFLFSMYGSGEITQGFCRLSAVFGGIYALNQSLNGLVFDETGNFKALISGKQRISAEFLVMGTDKAPTKLIKGPPNKYISRAVFITDKSVMPDEKEHLTLLLYPPENGKNSCVILELGTLTGTCPNDLHIVHLISRQMSQPKDDFKHVVEHLFGDEGEKRPKILWSSYFSIPDCDGLDLKNGIPENCVVCPGPDLDLDYDNSVKIAKEFFLGIFPDAEFLPRAPDPEEIIIEGETEDSDEPEIVLKPEIDQTEPEEEVKEE